MKWIKFRFFNFLDVFLDFKWFIEVIEWVYGDMYFMVGDEIIKFVELKFKEEVNF